MTFAQRFWSFPRERGLINPVSVVVTVFLSACQTPPVPNPEGLPPDALTLKYVLDRGCFAYMLGEKSESEAMRGVGLNHQNPLPGFFQPPPGPSWRGLYAGLSNVVVGPVTCSVNMNGRNFTAYRAAVQSVLRSRFGQVVEQDAQAGFKQYLPGQVSGCHDGISYTFYENRGRTIFSVDLRRRDARSPTGPGSRSCRS